MSEFCYKDDGDFGQEDDLKKLLSLAKQKRKKITINEDGSVQVGLKKFKNMDGALGYLEGLGLSY